MEHIDLFNASSPKGKVNVFPLFELDKDGEIKLDLENDNEFNLEDLSFKAVNKGLGFHHKEALKNSAPLVKRATKTPLKEANTAPAVIIGKNPRTQNDFDPIALTNAEMALLGGHKTIQKMETPKTEPLHGEIPLKAEKKAKDAGIINQTVAWVVDIACITAGLATTVALFALLSGIQWSTLAGLVTPIEMAAFLGSLFVIYYLLYFTVLDLHQTPGKSLLGVRLERLDGRRVKVKQTFTRAMIGLLSFALLGLPLTMDFQGKLSDTKVVR